MNLSGAQKIVDELCKARSIDAVTVATSDHPLLMWSAMAYDPMKQTILVGRLDLQKERDELRAMLAHELAHHIRHSRPVRHWLATQALPLLFCIIATLPAWLPATLADPARLVLLMPGAAIMTWLLARFIAIPLMRQREEFICDRMGWQMTGDAGAAADTLDDTKHEAAWRPWHTHPPTSMRIQRAREAHLKAAA